MVARSSVNVAYFSMVLGIFESLWTREVPENLNLNPQSSNIPDSKSSFYNVSFQKSFYNAHNLMLHDRTCHIGVY